MAQEFGEKCSFAGLRSERNICRSHHVGGVDASTGLLMIKYAVIFLAVAGAMFAPAAPAQAQIHAEHPRFCVVNVGPTQMMFSAIQPSSDDIYCTHVPEIGETTIIMDARQPELRDMNIEVRLIRNIGQKDWRDNLDATMVVSLPRQKYLADKGTLTFKHSFDKDGEYTAVVKAISDDGAKEYVGEYDFSVGETAQWYVALAMFAGAVALVLLIMWRRHLADVAKSKPSAFRQSP